MDLFTKLLYVLAAILLLISFSKDRNKTKIALKKAALLRNGMGFIFSYIVALIIGVVLG